MPSPHPPTVALRPLAPAEPGPLRRAARRWLPRRLRSEVAIARRHLRDRRDSVPFATQRGDASAFPHAFEGYALPMVIYPGQEHLAEGKRYNQQLMAAALDGVRVEPSEVLSPWRCTGRPSARRGYMAGAAIVAGELTAEDGGGTCQISTVLYNAGLLAGLDVVERHPHSVDVYGEARYFEPGRDATIEYGVLDLRFRNPYPFAVLLALSSDDERVSAVFRAPVEELPRVEVDVEVPPAADAAWSARTLRTVTAPGGDPRRDDLGWSVYRVPDER